MTKKNLLALALILCPMICYSQLRVVSNGNSIVGTELYSNSDFNIKLQSGISTTLGYPRSVGIYGRSDCSDIRGINYGIMGVASNSSEACGYGVNGSISLETTNGAGILGTVCHEGYMDITGRYAGLFNGSVKVFGSVTASSFLTSSDYRLKENITSINERYTNILDKVLNINVVEFKYKKILPSMTLPDSISEEEIIRQSGIDPDKTHVGLIAQELRELFPTLVEEGQDGYLAVNYVELVPLLIHSIQELNQKIEILEKNANRRSALGTGINENEKMALKKNVLYQNMPNPFKEQTTIQFELTNDVKDAAICVFDMQGKMLLNKPISSGMESISINSHELGKGIFLYSLIVNGQEIDTKKMVISK